MSYGRLTNYEGFRNLTRGFEQHSFQENYNPLNVRSIHFNNLIKTPLILSGKTPEVKKLNKQFVWEASQINSLFKAMNENCIVTEADHEKINQLKREADRLDSRLDESDLSPAQLKHAKKCIAEMNKALLETQLLAEELEKIYPFQDQLNCAQDNLIDCCFSPLHPGEPLQGIEDIEASIAALQKLHRQIQQAPPGSYAAKRLHDIFEKETDALHFHLIEWQDIMIEYLEKEYAYLRAELKKNKGDIDLLRQLQAIQQMKGDLLKSLEALSAQTGQYPKLHRQLNEARQEIKKQGPSKEIQFGKIPALSFGSDEWVALVQSRPQHKMDWMERWIHLITSPEEWSERTKQNVYLMFTAAQLQQEVSSFSQRLGQVTQLKQQAKLLQEDVLKDLPEETFREIQKDAALLGGLLTDKYGALVDHPELLDKFAGQNPALRTVLEQALKQHGPSPPNRQQVSAIQDAYKSQRIVQEAKHSSFFQNLSWNEWWELFSTPQTQIQEETSNGSASAIATSAASEPLPATSSASKLQAWPLSQIRALGQLFSFTQVPNRDDFISAKTNEGQNELQAAAKTLSNQADQIAKLPPDAAVKQLRQEIDHLQKQLKELSRLEPKDTCTLPDLADWMQKVDDKCYAVRDFEKRIFNLMESAREAWTGNVADLEAFGAKHLNIVLQGRLYEGLPIPGVAVPEPYGLKSEEAHAFLKKHAPEIFKDWEKLGQLYSKYEDQAPFLTQPEPQALLDKIQQRIQEVFNEAGKSETLYQDLFPAKARAGWESIHQENGFLMVRSTGAEDSRQTANAGGNISKAYVPSTRESICSAAGEVIASYFGFSSLQNRLNAGLNPFEQELALSVTSQRLIGEPVGGATKASEIPVSLVLFTEEPLYIGEEKFRVMRVSATYGHGEAVVGTQGIATDTALLLVSEAHPDQLYVLYDNQPKPERLAPLATPDGVKLGKIKNPNPNKPALSEELLHRLYVVGVVEEMFFDGHPTDIEAVIMNHVLYLVQARPINRQPMLPTYLDPKKMASQPHLIKEKIQGEMLVPGKASVVVIKNPNEILDKPTLEEAEKAFIKDQHTLVIVSQQEPSNSHPVVNFSSLGMPCLVIKDRQSIEKLKNQISEQNPAAACMQASTLSLFATDPDPFISHGFAVHPAKIATSLPVPQLSPAKVAETIPQEVRDLLIEIRSAATHEAALLAIKRLRAHGWSQTAKTKRQALKEIMQQHQIVPLQVSQTYQVLKGLDRAVERSFDELEASFKAAPSTERLRPLIHAKVLETLMLSQPGTERSLSQYSLLDVEPLFQQAQATIEYQKQFSFPCHLVELLSVGEQAYTSEGKQKWTSFLKQLEPLIEKGEISKEQVQEFKAVIQTLNKHELTPAWMALIFNYHPDNVKQTLNEVLETFGETETIAEQKREIVDVQRLHSQLESMRGQLSRFQDPAQFESAFEDLQKMVSKFSAEELSQQLQHSSPLVKATIYKIMDEMVELYDSAIKTMKASPSFSQEEKTLLFKKMLDPYFSLLNSWAPTLTPNIPVHPEWGLSRYLPEMQRVLKNLPTNNPQQLYPSNGFSVSAAKLGAQTAFERHLPETGEDLFTLTHQNLKEVLNTLYNGIYTPDLLETADLPQSVKTAMDLISSIPSQRQIEFLENEIRIKYNVPLRNHSAQLVLIYDKEQDKLTLEGQFFGEARERWDFLAEMIKILNYATIPLEAPPKVGSLELNFTWLIRDSSRLEFALSEFRRYCDLSLTGIVQNSERQLLLSRLPSEDLKIVLHKLAEENSPTSIKWLIQIGKLGFREEVLEILIRNVNHENIQSDILEAIILEMNTKEYSGETLRFIKMGIESPNVEVQEMAVDFLVKFSQTAIGANYALDYARKTSDALDSENQYDIEKKIKTFSQSLIIYEHLINHLFYEKSGEFYQEAFDVLIKGMETVKNRNLYFKFLDEKKDAQQRDQSQTYINDIIDQNIIPTVLSMIDTYVDEGYNLQNIANQALQVLESNNNFSLAVFEKLVHQQRAFPEALSAAQQVLAQKEEGSPGEPDAYRLLTNLVTRNYGLNEAYDLIKDLHPTMFSISEVTLLLKLMDQGIGFAKALEITQNENIDFFHAARLFEKLIEVNQAENEAKALALSGLEVSSNREVAIGLLEKLVEKGFAIPEALKLAKKWTEPEENVTKDEQKLEFGLRLFYKLIEQSQVTQEAFSAALMVVEDDPSSKLGELGKQIIRSLISSDQIPILMPKAVSLLKDDKLKFELLSKLVAKGRGIEEAIYAARGVDKQSIQSEEDYVMLMNQLVQRGHEIHQALQALSKLELEKGSIETYYPLYVSLVEKGEAVPDAIDLVTNELENAIKEQRSLHHSCQNILILLIQNGHANKELLNLIPQYFEVFLYGPQGITQDVLILGSTLVESGVSIEDVKTFAILATYIEGPYYETVKILLEKITELEQNS